MYKMRIDEPHRLSRILSYRSGAAQGERVPGGSKPQKDVVRISAEAKELLEAQRSHSAERAERVASLKRQVRTGTYFVRADLVAEKMLPFLKD